MRTILLSHLVPSGIILFVGFMSSTDDPLVDVTRKIAAEVTENGKAYADLRELTTIGPRLSGSEGAAKAVEWAKGKMEAYGFERVVLQPAMVPHWTRGNVERATVTSTPQPISLAVTSLGNSVGTPKDGWSGAARRRSTISTPTSCRGWRTRVAHTFTSASNPFGRRAPLLRSE